MLARILLAIFFLFCLTGMLIPAVSPRQCLAKMMTWTGTLAALALISASLLLYAEDSPAHFYLWTIPGLTTLKMTIDKLSAIFLCTAGLVLLPGSIYASGELKAAPDNTPKHLIVILIFALFASIALILAAAEAFLFLLAWEGMSICCYLIIVLNRSKESDHPKAAYLSLAVGEFGTLAAAFGFILFAVNANTLEFAEMKAQGTALSTSVHWWIFLLSFFGFGAKAGLIPLNFWMADAYALAPRYFAPLLAGATLNLGIYAIMRVNLDILPVSPVECGLIVLGIGTLSGLLGILYAAAENDLKKMLSQSSIENAGVITAGLGASMTFSSTGRPELASIAMIASLYHLINHSFYKTLLFFGTGAIESATGLRDMDRLGGLIKWLPLTSFCFLIGTLSISALPPFNGFVSEWLTLQAMLRSTELESIKIKIAFALSGAGLALIAGLAVTCFVKVFAMTFLGMRRFDGKITSLLPAGTKFSLCFLSLLCFIAGVLPTYVISFLNQAVSPITGGDALSPLVPPFFSSKSPLKGFSASFMSEFQKLGAEIGKDFLPGRGLVILHLAEPKNTVAFALSTTYMVILMAILLISAYIVFKLILTHRRRSVAGEVWSGGIRRLLPEMTYTATGFSNCVRVIFEAVFRPTTVEDTKATVLEHFRTAIIRKKEHVPIVEKLFWLPLQKTAFRIANQLGRLHHGRFNLYAAYTLLTLIAALIFFLNST